MENICLLLIVILPWIIKDKVDPETVHQAIDTYGLEEMKLCEFFASVVVAGRCLILLFATLEMNSTGIP
jgi:hypothetical protein